MALLQSLGGGRGGAAHSHNDPLHFHCTRFLKICPEQLRQLLHRSGKLVLAQAASGEFQAQLLQAEDILLYKFRGRRGLLLFLLAGGQGEQQGQRQQQR